MLIIMFGKFWTKLSGYRKYQEAILCTSERRATDQSRSTKRQPMRSSLASQLGSDINKVEIQPLIRDIYEKSVVMVSK